MAPKRKPEEAQVQSVARTLRILETLAAEGELGLTELAERVGMHKSTLFRFMRTFSELGYARRDGDTERFSLTLKVFELGSSVYARVDLVKLASPVLARLSATTEETVHLAILDGNQLVYLSKIESPRALRVAMQSGVGLTAPAYCTGLGKVLLAFADTRVLDSYLAGCDFVHYTENTLSDRLHLLAELQVIRNRGWAVDNEEHEYGVRCVAAPVRSGTGAVAAALSVSGPTIRLTPDRVDIMRELVCEAAKEISRLLGYVPANHEPTGRRRPAARNHRGRGA
ncbi:MAG TPA: IclR family transcriptional regulator C-terminal domain-containing protein [Anaeromyxobacter sp.]|nr:IclR family transcriptional regulator C-terminal domain-containing protein [Anaeromyxobacter sp.]